MNRELNRNEQLPENCFLKWVHPRTTTVSFVVRLAPGGRALLVVGKNLGADSLQRWLGEQGYPTERIASAKGFRVLETRHP